MRLLRTKDQVEICELYQDRFSPSELAIVKDVSIYQILSVLHKYGVKLRTPEERL